MFNYKNYERVFKWLRIVFVAFQISEFGTDDEEKREKKKENIGDSERIAVPSMKREEFAFLSFVCILFLLSRTSLEASNPKSTRFPARFLPLPEVGGKEHLAK
ncbi:hypothetical protein RUM43_006206 [Polyplax serrata]|uniref:Uncharacterized protein n=1 Tax=Polyplax serrata TaxID=468196 RepID=A0AAN8NRL3_POLSC